MELVQAFITGVKAVASGSVKAVASAIENALAKAVPVVIGFLAALLGLGGLAQKVIAIFKKIHDRVEKGLITLWTKIKTLGKNLLSKITGKTKNKVANDPEKQKKLNAGFVYLKEQEKNEDDNHNNKLTLEQAQDAAKRTKAKHPVFSSIQAEANDEKIKYKYTASPEDEFETGTEIEKWTNNSRINEYTIEPKFTVYANNPSEFNSQLNRQIAGINKMVVKEWKKNREEFKIKGRKKGDLELIRERIRNDIATNYIKNNKQKLITLGDKEMDLIAQDYAKTILTSKHAILHEPDQVAGGQVFLDHLYKDGDITDKTALDASFLVGDRGANSSIGSQWGANKHERAEGILNHVNTEVKQNAEKENYLMNVKLN